MFPEHHHNNRLPAVLILVTVGSIVTNTQNKAPSSSQALALTPATMARVGTIDPRFQSYNVEMLEVTGGAFWKPYGAAAAPAKDPKTTRTPAGMDPNLYQYRPPIDLTNARLRTLAAALAPAYVRVSGTWANSTYFPELDWAPADPPAGFEGVLTRQQWRGVVDFSKAVDARIVTSFATSVGVRDASGVWTPHQARRWVEYTRSVDGEIAAAEFMNEPTLAAMGGAPKGYDAVAYGRDFNLFKAFADQTVPDMLIVGPGSVGETSANSNLTYGSMPFIRTAEMLAASGPGVDAFSYHHYGAASIRCAGTEGMPRVPIQQGLHVYAHCQPGSAGGVTLLVINNDRQQTRALMLPVASQRYTLDAAQLNDKTVRLNEQPLALREGDSMPALAGDPTGAGEVAFKPATITFLAIPMAANNTCR